jgi:hypothetical protein
MFEHYKKTFWGMQLVMLVVFAAIWAYSHVLGLALLFFVTMQVSSLVGASWAARLKAKLRPGMQGQCSNARAAGRPSTMATAKSLG